MKKSSDKFVRLIHDYLTIFLPKQSGCSQHTVLAAKQVWNMLLNHICATTGKKAEKLTFADINYASVMGFLDAKEEERDWTPKTRNHRLGAIRSFFRYVSGVEPTLSYYLEELKKIPMKKTQDRSFILEYMSESAISTMLNQPDISKKMGVRDTFFMSLMYDTAARDSELLSMLFHNLDPVNKTVYLLGKGNKPRMVPIDDNTVSQFYRYAKLYHSTGIGERPLFYTTRKGSIGQMSDDNAARIIKKYADETRAHYQDMPDKITPHTLRKSRSMHMYQRGMPLELIALILGHEDPQTTRIYAKANLDMKRKAMEKVKDKMGNTLRHEEEDLPVWLDNEEMIRLLCGLD
jgi:site-specific recombinase XerD